MSKKESQINVILEMLNNLNDLEIREIIKMLIQRNTKARKELLSILKDNREYYYNLALEYLELKEEDL